MKTTLVDKLKAARRCSTPLIAITTPDPAATIQQVVEQINGNSETPQICWDIAQGLVARNDEGAVALATLGEDVTDATKGDPLEALTLAQQLPNKTILFFCNAHRYLDNAAVMQACWNLRDKFKADRRTLVLLGPCLQLPIELQTDVVTFDEPLPTTEQLGEIVSGLIEGAEDELTFKADDELIARTASALRGCSAFAAEQLAAMALRKTGIDNEYLTTQAKKLIEQTPGLTFERGEETFDDIGGLDFAKQFGRRMFDGPSRPEVVVRVEELEKAMAGSTGGDMSGTSSDALQVMLSALEDNSWNGMLAAGPAGSGKSLYSKSLANTFDAKPIRFDINACKGSLVGQSEQMIRQAVKVIETLGGKNVFFVASVNRIESLPPELQRRFRCGIWFFDIPTQHEADQIWAINRTVFSIAEDDPTPADADLTGADIRNICEMAYSLACTLKEAMEFVVPLKVQSPGAIQNARKAAKGRFISAAYGGVFDPDKATKTAKRKVEV